MISKLISNIMNIYRQPFGITSVCLSFLLCNCLYIHVFILSAVPLKVHMMLLLLVVEEVLWEKQNPALF